MSSAKDDFDDDFVDGEQPRPMSHDEKIAAFQKQVDDETGETAIRVLINEFVALPPTIRRAVFHRMLKAVPGGTLEAIKDVDKEEVEVWSEVKRLRLRAEAKRRFDAEQRVDEPMPELVGLADFLAVPDEDVRYRVDGLWPTNGRVVLSAQNKAGKTTLSGNLIRSFADGDPFLGQFTVEKVGRVVLADNELSPNMIRAWLRDQEIGNQDAVDVLSLRGRLSSFNILDPEVRSRWATALGPADILIFDCLRPALDALGLSEDKDAGRFLEALDELIAEAGIRELLVIHHMGHSNERSRGDSRILDWPDAVWKLVRESADDPMSTRFFSAYGRDVDQPEVRLAYSGDFGRRLTVDGGSRRQERTRGVEDDIVEFVRDNQGCSQNAIENGVSGDRNTIRGAIRELVASGVLRIEKVGQQRKHFLTEPQDGEK